MNRILNYGSLNVDHVYSVPHIVRPGETISALDFQTFPGGKGLNQSVAMARAGACVYHGGKIGVNGKFLRDILVKDEIDCTWLRESGAPNGSAIIQKDKEGQNAIICYAGSNGNVEVDEIDEALEAFDDQDILVVQNEISHVPYLIEQAGKKGMRIAFNPSPIDETVIHMDFSPITWLVINETEGYELTGEESPERIVEQLLRRYPDMAVILTLGEHGSMYCSRALSVHQTAHNVEVKDTTAAGDTFLGYFVGSYVNGCDVESSLKRASLAAGIAVARDGAVPSIPYGAEVGI